MRGFLWSSELPAIAGGGGLVSALVGGAEVVVGGVVAAAGGVAAVGGAGDAVGAHVFARLRGRIRS